MDKEKNIVSKALSKADDVFNSLKKAYTDRVSAKNFNDYKTLSINPTETTGVSFSKQTPEEGNNKYSFSAYSNATEKMPDKKYSANTPLGDVSIGVDDGMLRGSYISPWEKYKEEAPDPYGQYYLGDIGTNPSETGITTSPTDASLLTFDRLDYPNGMKDYEAFARTGMSLPTFDRAYNTPLGSIAFGMNGKLDETDPYSVAYADYIPNKETMDAYQNIKNAIAKRMFLNSKGTEL